MVKMSCSCFLWFFLYVQIQIVILIADAKFVLLVPDDHGAGISKSSTNPQDKIFKILASECLNDFARSINEGDSGEFFTSVERMSKKWHNSTIPFEISTNMSVNGVKIITEAIQHYENRTCLKFKHKSAADEDYIYFNNLPLGCFSIPIGRKGGRLEINLDERLCLNNSESATYEIFRALGFTPKRIRPDRDEYIGIRENMASGLNSSFEKEKDKNVDILGFAYDYQNIAHIRATSSSKNCSVNTVSAKQPDQKVGPSEQLDTLDKLKIKKQFNCNHPKVTTTTSSTNRPTTATKNKPRIGTTTIKRRTNTPAMTTKPKSQTERTTEKPSPSITTTEAPITTTKLKPQTERTTEKPSPSITTAPTTKMKSKPQTKRTTEKPSPSITTATRPTRCG